MPDDGESLASLVASAQRLQAARGPPLGRDVASSRPPDPGRRWGPARYDQQDRPPTLGQRCREPGPSAAPAP